MTNRLFLIKELDSRLIAVLFRLYMVLYGLIIIIWSCSEKILNIPSFILCMCFLAFLAFQLSRASKRWSQNKVDIINLMFDTGWCICVASSRGVFDNHVFCLTLTPLLGYAVLSKPSFSPWVFATVPVTVLATLWLKGGFCWSYMMPYFFLSYLIWIGRYRERFVRTTIKLNDAIDNFFATRSNYDKPHKIYDILIKGLEIPVHLKVQVSEIYCFVCGYKAISLYNSSRFVLEYNIQYDDELRDKLWREENGGYIGQVRLSLNNKIRDDLHGYSVNLDNSKYLFMIKFGQSINNPIKQIIAGEVLLNVFGKLARMLETERNLKLVAEEQMNELAHKVNYVNAAINSMHYIRNELTPLKNYIAMKSDYEQEKDPERKAKISSFVDQEYKKVASSFKQIVEMASSIYEKANNPFSYSSNEKVRVELLYSEIRRLWDYYELDVMNIKVIEWEKSAELCEVLCNREAIQLVLDNWISNISKYGKEEYAVAVSNTEKEFVIEFKNAYDKSGRTDFVKSYSDNKKQEINRNRWVGLGIIKDCLDQMEIDSEMRKDDMWIYFKITMKKWRKL